MKDTEHKRDALDMFFDIQGAKNLVGYALRSVRRHRLLAGAVVVIVVAAMGALIPVLPKQYQVETRVLAQPSYIIAQLAQPGRRVSSAADKPTRGVVETMTSRKFLQDIILAAELEDYWTQNRNPLGALKDATRELFLGSTPQEAIHDGLIALLERRMKVWVEGNTIVVRVLWGHPEVAAIIASNAVTLLLDRRQTSELSQIRESITIVNRTIGRSRMRMAESGRLLEDALKSRETKLDDRGRRKRRKGRSIVYRRPTGTVTDLDARRAELVRLRAQYDAGVARAENRVDQLRETLGPDHPDLKLAEREVEKVSLVPPQLAALAAELSRAQDEAQREPEANAKKRSFDVVSVPVSAALEAAMDTDPEIQQMLDDLRGQTAAHNDLLKRLENSRIELETAKAAFDYRYTITTPPVIPNRPTNAGPGKMLGGAAFVGLFLALLLCVVRDLASGQILEPWQIESALGVKLLGEVREH